MSSANSVSDKKDTSVTGVGKILTTNATLPTNVDGTNPISTDSLLTNAVDAKTLSANPIDAKTLLTNVPDKSTSLQLTSSNIPTSTPVELKTLQPNVPPSSAISPSFGILKLREQFIGLKSSQFKLTQEELAVLVKVTAYIASSDSVWYNEWCRTNIPTRPQQDSTSTMFQQQVYANLLKSGDPTRLHDPMEILATSSVMNQMSLIQRALQSAQDSANQQMKLQSSMSKDQKRKQKRKVSKALLTDPLLDQQQSLSSSKGVKTVPLDQQRSINTTKGALTDSSLDAKQKASDSSVVSKSKATKPRQPSPTKKHVQELLERKRLEEIAKKEDFKQKRRAKLTEFIKCYGALAKTVKPITALDRNRIDEFKRGRWYCNLTLFEIPELQKFNHIKKDHIAFARYLTEADEKHYEDESEFLRTADKKSSKFVAAVDTKVDTKVDAKVNTKVDEKASSTTSNVTPTITPIDWKEEYGKGVKTFRVFPCGHCFLDAGLLCKTFDLCAATPAVQIISQLTFLFQNCLICGPHCVYDSVNRLRMYVKAPSVNLDAVQSDSTQNIIPCQFFSAITNELKIGDVVDSSGIRGRGLWIYEGNSRFLKVPVNEEYPIWPLEYLKLRGWAFYLKTIPHFDELLLPNGLKLVDNPEFDQGDDKQQNEPEFLFTMTHNQPRPDYDFGLDQFNVAEDANTKKKEKTPPVI